MPQMEKVESDLNRSKQLREKQTRELQKQLEEQRLNYEKKVTESILCLFICLFVYVYLFFIICFFAQWFDCVKSWGISPIHIAIVFVLLSTKALYGSQLFGIVK